MRKRLILILVIIAAAAVPAGIVLYRNRPVRTAESRDGYWKGWILKGAGDSYTGFLAYQGSAAIEKEIRMQYCGDTACHFGVLVPDGEPLGALQALLLGCRTKDRYLIGAYPPGTPDALLYEIEWVQDGETMTDSLEW